MNQVDGWGLKSHGMDLEEDLYSFDLDTEEIYRYQDPSELLVALKQKEEEVILAAQLGNALLLENRQLKEENDKLHEKYTDKLEELEQGRHQLRLRLDGCRMDWKDQVTELERDARDLSFQVERLTQALSQAEQEKSRAQEERVEQGLRLREQLNTEKRVGSHYLSISALEEEVVLNYLEGSVAMGDFVLSAAVKEHERRLSTGGASLDRPYSGGSLCPSTDIPLPDLVNSGASISRCADPGVAAEVERALTTELRALKQELQERGHPRPQDEELLSAMKEQVARMSQKEQALEQRLQTLSQENADLQDSLKSQYTRLALHDRRSLHLSEQLVEAQREAEAGRCRSQQLQAQLEELQEEMSLLETSQGNGSLLSELEHSLEGMDWGQDKEQVTQEVLSILRLLLPLTSPEKVPEDVEGQEVGLRAALLQLKSVAHKLADNERPQELNPSIVAAKGDLCGNAGLTQELQCQNAKLREENAKLKLRAENIGEGELVQQAIRDRDEAIAKKIAMETELIRSKNDMMSLNNQLLEAIQRKLELSQELEAWQDDIQVILNQQLKSQQQSEQAQRKTKPLAFLRRPSVPSLKPQRPSSSLSWAPETGAERTQVPWKDWLRRGKLGHYGN